MSKFAKDVFCCKFLYDIWFNGTAYDDWYVVMVKVFYDFINIPFSGAYPEKVEVV